MAGMARLLCVNCWQRRGSSGGLFARPRALASAILTKHICIYCCTPSTSICWPTDCRGAVGAGVSSETAARGVVESRSIPDVCACTAPLALQTQL